MSRLHGSDAQVRPFILPEVKPLELVRGMEVIRDG